MRIASRLALLLSLALAAMAVAAAAAYATTTATTTETGTAAETGDYTASERGAGSLRNDALTVTCTTSTVNGTISNVSKGTDTTVRVTIEGLTFESCQDGSGTPCTVTVDGNTLPANAWVTFTGTTPEGAFTLKDNESVTVRIECGAFITCDATGTTTIMGDVFNGDPGRLVILTNTVILTGFGCDTTTPDTPVWDSAWTIDTTSDGTHTSTTLSA